MFKLVFGFGLLLSLMTLHFSVAQAQKMVFVTKGINFGFSGGLGQRWSSAGTKSAGPGFNGALGDVKISWGNAFAFSAGVDLTGRLSLGLSYGYAFNDIAWRTTTPNSSNRYNGILATESLLLRVKYRLPLGQIRSIGSFSLRAKIGGGVAVNSLTSISEYLNNSNVKAAAIDSGRTIRPMALGSLSLIYHPSKKVSFSAGVDLNITGGFRSGSLRKSAGGSTSKIGRHRFNPVSGVNFWIGARIHFN